MANITFDQRVLGLGKKYNTFIKTTFMPTGSLVMDTVMGGGLPVGKMIELASESGVGKTTVTLSICRELLLAGKRVVYLDHEGAVSTSQLEGIFGTYKDENGNKHFYADKWVWNEDTNPDGIFYLFQVMTYSESEDILNNMLGSDLISLVVIDSVTSMIADEYLEEVENPDSKDGKGVTDQRPAVDARLLNKFVKKFKGVCTKHNVTMILINQLRTNLNITGYGQSNKVSTGGAAIEYFPDIRLKLEKPVPVYAEIKNNLTGEAKEKQQIGCDAIIWAYKNKLGTGKVKVPISIVYGKGISNLRSYLLWLTNKKVMFEGSEIPMLVQRGGGYATLTLKSGKQVQTRGEKALLDAIKENFAEIRSSFGPEDFKITENISIAEFNEDGTRSYEITPDEPFSKELPQNIILDDEEE